MNQIQFIYISNGSRSDRRQLTAKFPTHACAQFASAGVSRRHLDFHWPYCAPSALSCPMMHNKGGHDARRTNCSLGLRNWPLTALCLHRTKRATSHLRERCICRHSKPGRECSASALSIPLAAEPWSVHSADSTHDRCGVCPALCIRSPPIIRDLTDLGKQLPQKLSALHWSINSVPVLRSVNPGSIERYFASIAGTIASLVTNVTQAVAAAVAIPTLTAYLILDSERAFNWAMSLFHAAAAERASDRPCCWPASVCGDGLWVRPY
jgi:hypothetical protein